MRKSILGIETSCDETAAAVIEAKDNRVNLLSNIISSSIALHTKTGGIIPEIAAREQVKYIIPVIRKALQGSTRGVDARNPAGFIDTIDAIAVTVGPGLVGSLLVGIETAKTLAYAWNKPIVPVNHLIGHIYANWISTIDNLQLAIDFPAIALVVSGGHTDLVLMKDHQKLQWIGGTLDDAAGEAFDKVGRLLGLPYPGGPAIAKAARNGNPKAFIFPRPMIDSDDFDFSFSGLKTAVYREVNQFAFLRKVKTIRQLNNETISDVSASVQQAIVDVLVTKTLRAAKQYRVKSILLAGGVAANDKLREELQLNAKIFVPPKNLCTDNAAMIASAAFFNYNPVSWNKIKVDPDLYYNSYRL